MYWNGCWGKITYEMPLLVVGGIAKFAAFAESEWSVHRLQWIKQGEISFRSSPLKLLLHPNNLQSFQMR